MLHYFFRVLCVSSKKKSQINEVVMELLILLGIPIAASLALAFIGDRRLAPEVNIIGSAATFVAGVKLAFEVYKRGPILAGNDFFFIDAFSVYLTVLTAFVSMTTAIFSRRYM